MKISIQKCPSLVSSINAENKPEKNLLIVEPSFEKAPSSSSAAELAFSETNSTLTKFSMPLSSIEKCALIPLLSADSFACLANASAMPDSVIVEIFKLPRAL